MEKIMAYIAGALIGVLWFSLALAAEPAAEDETTAETDRSLTEEMESIDQAVTADAWNIRNGCVPLRRVRRIEFVDDQTAIITLFGKKKVVLRLQRCALESSAMAFCMKTEVIDFAKDLIDLLSLVVR